LALPGGSRTVRAMPAPLILVTNDDGFRAEGIAALAEAMQPLGEVWVVAPDTPQSATSHALTLHKPLRLKQRGERSYSVTGTPTDTVFVGVQHLVPRKPALLVSGINHGPNIGDDVSYSGTVSAALEGSLMGVPSIGFSHIGLGERDFHDGAAFATALARRVLAEGLPPKHYLNVNFPDVPRGQCKGVKVTTLGHRTYEDNIVKGVDPRGKPYYWIGGSGFEITPIPGTDCLATHEGYIAVTALQSDPSSPSGNDLLRGWGIEREGA
jgi:5'-nucleotidase